jgi:hypothetical protein
MEKRKLIQSLILPGPYGPNRRVYRIGLAGEKRLSELIGNSVQLVLRYYSKFRNSLSKCGKTLNVRKDDAAPDGRILFTAIPHLKKEDLDALLFLSMRSNSAPIEIIGSSENIEDFGIDYRKVKGSIYKLKDRKGTFSEIWLKWMSELENLSSAMKSCKKALSSKGVLYVIVPFEPEKDEHELSIREYIRGDSEPDSKTDKIHQSKVGSIIKTQFSSCGFIDLFPGLDVYYCINDT